MLLNQLSVAYTFLPCFSLQAWLFLSLNQFPNNLVQEITGGVGVDIAVEALGKPQTFQQCIQSVRDGGKAVMIGLADSSARGEVDINRLVRRKVH